MSNMSYARFQNTLRDLKDCYDHLGEDLTDRKEEEKAREELINLCRRITEVCE